MRDLEEGGGKEGEGGGGRGRREGGGEGTEGKEKEEEEEKEGGEMDVQVCVPLHPSSAHYVLYRQR